MKSAFTLTKDQKTEMIGLIQRYFANERDEQIGELAAMLLLEFFIEELAPMFYNLGVEDSHAYLSDKIDDLFALQKKGE